MQACSSDFTRSIFALLTVLLFAWPAVAEPPPEKDCEIRITPYIEFSNIAGSMTAQGREIDISPALTPWGADMREGFEIEIAKLPPNVKIIRFFNSW